MGIFQHDGVNRGEIERIVDEYPGQSIDFFGAMRARVYDDKVRVPAYSNCIKLILFDTAPPGPLNVWIQWVSQQPHIIIKCWVHFDTSFPLTEYYLTLVPPKPFVCRETLGFSADGIFRC